MKILHINCNYTGTTLHQLMIEKLSEAGYENSVFVPVYDKNVSVITPNENVTVCKCFKKRDRLIFDYKQKKIQKALESNIDVSGAEIIHAYTLFTDGNCARRLSKKYNIPYVVAIRNTDVNNFFRMMPHLRKRGIKIMADASAVFFLSESYRKIVFDKYVPQKYQEKILSKTYIIPNGIDKFWSENFPDAEKEIDKKKLKLVYAGRIDKNKNIPAIQKAIDILYSKGYEASLTVVGKVEDEKEFGRIKANRFTGCLPAMPKEELIKVYRKSDIFVMPSYTESFGLVYAEAMSQGLPVIYTKGQGFDEQFEEGLVGYHVDPDSPEEICENILKITSEYEKFPEQCIKSSKKFNWDSITKEYIKIYQTIKECAENV